MMTEHYLLTGGSGFVGSVLAEKLVENGKKVTLILRNKELNWRLINIKEKINTIFLDIRNPELIEVVKKLNPSHIFHLAASGVLSSNEEKITDMVETNINGTINLLEAMRNLKSTIFINTGTSSEYGVCESEMSEDDKIMPYTGYGITKSSATLLTSYYAKRYSIPAITLRLFSPYGYNEHPDRLIAYSISRAIRNMPLELSSPDFVRDFIFIDDVIDAYLTFNMGNIVSGSIYNIGSGNQTSIGDLIKHICSISNSKSTVIWKAKKQYQRQIEPTVWKARIDKIERDVGWKPKTSLHLGISKTIEWIKDRQDIYTS